MNRRFHLDKGNGKLLGVCAGLANYFAIDPMVVRIVWVISTLAFGLPLIVYIALALIAD